MILLNVSVKGATTQEENATNKYFINYLALSYDENKHGITLICVSSNDALKIGDMQEDLGFTGRELSRMTERYKIEKKKVFRFRIKSGLSIGGSILNMVGGGMLATGNADLKKPGYALIAVGSSFIALGIAI